MQKQYRAPSPEVFRRPRARLFDSAALGITRLAAKLVIILLAGLFALYVFTIRQADLDETRADAVLEALLVKADTIAAAIEGAGVGEPLLRLAPPAEGDPAFDAGIPVVTEIVDVDAVERILARALEGSATRARLYGIRGGEPLVDSRLALRTRTDVTAAPLPPLVATGESSADALTRLLTGASPRSDPAEDPATLTEVADALGGVKSVRPGTTPAGDMMLSVAVPLRDGEGDVVGALRVTSAPEAVSGAVAEQEAAIRNIFLVAAAAAVVLSLFLAASISRPIRRLARAAERIQRGGGYMPMPEIRDSGEVGELSRVLHDMTVALYDRIDSIEAFAGEVAHELKNPLTSLRSAVETLPLAKTDKARDRLLDVIQHDVRRIDRLITDISDASKLDAELNRRRHERFDLIRLLRAVTDTQAELARERGQVVELVVRSPRASFPVLGNDSRLGQVFTNLIDNARSFTPEGGKVTVAAQRFESFIEVVVDDEGPGIDEAVMERIFERFYTDRSEQQSFGDNSGLGLAISRQIVEAHGGEIFAENRYITTLGPDREVAGARLTVRLPVAD